MESVRQGRSSRDLSGTLDCMGERAYTKVTILGDEYRIAGEAHSASVPELAAYVDGKMNAVRQQSTHPDPKRVAVLASLNLADELFRERARNRALTAEVEKRIARIDAVLTASLGKAAQDSPAH